MTQNAPDMRDRIKSRLKLSLLDMLDGAHDGQSVTLQRRRQLEENLRKVIQNLLKETPNLQLPKEDQEQLIMDAVKEVVGFDLLDRLIADPTITEIMINGHTDIWVERDGNVEHIEEKFRSNEHLMSVIERMLSSVNLTVNEANPICDASLPDGSRINVIVPPLTMNGPVVTMRRKGRDWTMQDYIETGAVSPQVAEFLDACVKAKINIVVSGGTSTGKTTLVSVLSASIPSRHRIITIENVAELELMGREHWIRLVGKPANSEGHGEVNLRLLVKNALRMRPDRIILGEARGGEAMDVVQAMHSGHDGFVTVLHANSAKAALGRLETLMLMSGLDLPPAACRMQIAGAVDLVVHLSRFVDGSRRVSTITQVMGATADNFETEDLFVFDAEGFSADGRLLGTQRYTGITPKCLPKFPLNNVAIPSWVTTT